MTEQKTTRRRPTRTAKSEPKVEVNVVEEKVEVIEKVVESKPVKQPLTDSDKVTVMNNTTGRYGYVGKSGYSFQLEEYGDTADVPFGELRAMSASKQKRHITDAFIIILDDEAVEELNYSKLYEDVLDVDGVESILSQPEKLKLTLPKMPKIMRETVITIARQKYKNGELNDLRVINAIKDSVDINIME